MKFHLTFLFLAGVLVAFVAAAPKKTTGKLQVVVKSVKKIFKSGWSRVQKVAKIIYKELCKADGENRCIELTKETYQSVLQPYRPQIKAKCEEYEAAGNYLFYGSCIALIKTIKK